MSASCLVSPVSVGPGPLRLCSWVAPVHHSQSTAIASALTCQPLLPHHNTTQLSSAAASSPGPRPAPRTVQFCTALYCTVLHCTVPCTKNMKTSDKTSYFALIYSPLPHTTPPPAAATPELRQIRRTDVTLHLSQKYKTTSVSSKLMKSVPVF